MANSPLIGVLIVLGCTVLAVGGLFVFLRWMPHLATDEDEGPKGIFFSMVGVLYAVLLAFVVVIVWSDFVDAGHTSQTEVTRLSNLARDAGAFPPETRDRVRARLVAYAQAVAGPEWESMGEGQASPVAADAYEDIWAEYYRLRPETDEQAAFLGESIGRLNELGENRRLRLLQSRASVPTPMWLLLIAGFVITVGWTYLFGTARLATHVIAAGSIAALTGFVLYLIFAMQHPFAGSVKISPRPFVEFVQQFGA
jgi:hypothetical protein